MPERSDPGGTSQVELAPYRSTLETLEPDAQTTEMHPNELAALAAYDASHAAPDTEVTGPPAGAADRPREPMPTLATRDPRQSEDRDGAARHSAFVLAGLALVVGFGAGWAISDIVGDTGRKTSQGSKAGPTASIQPSAVSARPASEGPLLERARAGEVDALAELESRSPYDRSSEENLALARGRVASKRRALELLVRQLEDESDANERHRHLRRMKDFLNDRDTTIAAARALTKLPGPDGPDVLYAAWVTTPERNQTTMLAEALVYSPDVRSKASAALAVALDLRQAESCEDYLAVVPRAAEQGDTRSLHLLGQLTRTAGCGPRGGQDCFACLRPLETDPNTAGLKQALRSVAERPAPDL